MSRASFSIGQIIERIYFIRNHRVIFEDDISNILRVKQDEIREVVRLNLKKFPKDFRFQITEKECNHLSKIFGLPSIAHYGGQKRLPYVYTQASVCMLSTHFNNRRVIRQSINIARAFSQLERFNILSKDLIHRLDEANKCLKDMLDLEVSHIMASPANRKMAQRAVGDFKTLKQAQKRIRRTISNTKLNSPQAGF